ncbi:hypothetical protein [Hyphomicrobium sp.]|uniref:hypothetical protein n=1 Tax=Hyphomicrobium sp. TaxID=82 RepID=UPI00345A2715
MRVVVGVIMVVIVVVMIVPMAVPLPIGMDMLMMVIVMMNMSGRVVAQRACFSRFQIGQRRFGSGAATACGAH